jgi:type II secretory pathway component PulC
MLVLALLAALQAPPDDLSAVGIVLSPRPETSVAILRSGGRSRVAAVGDTVFGGRVARIAPGLVVVEFGDGARELRLAASATAAAGPRPTAPEPPRETIADDGAEARTMERREVDKRLGAEIPRILAETTLLLRAGDVLTHVNDVPIDSLPTLIALWPKLQTASTLRAQVLRNGEPVSLTVTLR